MDKCREEFEKQRYWIGLFRADVDFDVTLGEFGRYVSNGSRRVDAMCLESFNEKWEAWANAWQSQQAKVEELQKRVDSVTHLIRGLRAEFDLWMDVECPQVERQIELLEQALKGEGQ
ncbi:hypothetical protein [Acinetobacter baumannii]|uniref:hypothetical protein n=1 Tax=Acinetobacter baumannii TaxID=470 RepID=UPI0034631C25